jgi:serine/threonine-protein kinase RsbW
MTHTREQYRSDLGALPQMRAQVSDACRRAWGSDEEAAERLALAVHEAGSNIMLHAYDGEPDRPIELAVAVEAERATATFCHAGRDFDPDTVSPPSFDGSRDRGFGLYMIHKVVDTVEFYREEDGRCAVRLTVLRQRPVPAAPGTGETTRA